MQTVTIDIINEKVLNLLKELELLKLIRLHKSKASPQNVAPDWSKYKGAMTRQPLEEVDKQLLELRNEWE